MRANLNDAFDLQSQSRVIVHNDRLVSRARIWWDCQLSINIHHTATCFHLKHKHVVSNNS